MEEAAPQALVRPEHDPHPPPLCSDAPISSHPAVTRKLVQYNGRKAWSTIAIIERCSNDTGRKMIYTIRNLLNDAREPSQMLDVQPCVQSASPPEHGARC